MGSHIATGKTKALVVESGLIFVLMFSVLIILCAFSTALAANVSLKWDAVSGHGVIGYKVYYSSTSAIEPYNGTGAAEGSSPVDVHNVTTTTLTGLDQNKSYYFAITAYDAAGNESGYSNVAAAVDLALPDVSITYPANNSLVTGTVPFTASASDNIGIARVEFLVNGVVKSTDTTTPYLYSWDTAQLATGSYTLTAKAYDAENNTFTSTAVTVSVNNTVPDTTLPVVSISNPVSNATLSSSVSVSANASDNVGVKRVDFYVNGALRASVNTSPYNFNWDTLAESNASYVLSCKAYDAAGNMGSSSNVSVTVNNPVSDTIVPVIASFTMPATSSSLSVPVSVLTATDNAGVTGYKITESSIAPTAGAAGWSATAPTNFTFSAAGFKTAYAWAKDAAGNVSAGQSASVTVTINYAISDALLALQIGSGKITPTAQQIARLDVAPVVNGKSSPNGKVDTGDAIALLSKLVGKSSF